MPDEGETVVHDLIRGDTAFRHVHLDDPVIARGDGRVLYNFAVAVDDHDAQITHVIRGEDHLSNTPKQLLVFEAMGAEPPVYAHIPLIYGPDGKKLSKRHGAASVQELRDAGYLPEAVRNYLALLGWGAEDDATKLSTDELVERFDIARVQKNPAQFDEKKLRWLNGQYIRELPVEELTARLEAFTGRTGLGPAVEISREKIQTLADFWPLAGFIFDGPGRRRRRRARSGSPTAAARRSRDARDGARRRSSRSTSSTSSRRCAASSRRARSSRRTSSSRSASPSRGPRSRPESSRPSRFWGATRRSRASIAPSR